jgi:hypothetical protein
MYRPGTLTISCSRLHGRCKARMSGPSRGRIAPFRETAPDSAASAGRNLWREIPFRRRQSELGQAPRDDRRLDDRGVGRGVEKKAIKERCQLIDIVNHGLSHEAILPDNAVGFHEFRRVFNHWRHAPDLAKHRPYSNMKRDSQAERRRLCPDRVPGDCLTIFELVNAFSGAGIGHPCSVSKGA